MPAAKHFFISSQGCTFSKTNFPKFVYSNKFQESGKTSDSAVLSIMLRDMLPMSAEM